MKTLNESQIERQDSVDNAIYHLIQELNPTDNEINKKFISKGTSLVIPASEARRESLLKKDSGRAGMTELAKQSSLNNVLLVNGI